MVGLVMYTGGLQHLRSYCIRYTTSFQKPGDVYLVKHESEWCAAVYTVGSIQQDSETSKKQIWIRSRNFT
jgi:hypothetical protein